MPKKCRAEMAEERKRRSHYVSFSVCDSLISAASLLAATGVCYLIRLFDTTDIYVPVIYLLAVFLISRYTEGYLYGALGSLVSVLLVNYMFTFPYFYINFTLPGYPVTFFCMLTVSIITCAMTTQIKAQNELKVEAVKEKTRSNLLRAISHDLRTPLTSILGAASVLIENDDLVEKPKRLKLLTGIKEDSEWLISMVENLLSITRIDGSPDAKIAKTAEPAEEVLANAMTKFRKRFPDMVVSVSAPEELLMIPLDAMLIQQVILNLLENVVLHAKGANHIQLSVSRSGNEAVFQVRDDGCGIPGEILPRLFEGMLSSSRGRADARKNMGIGLSVCQSIVRAHGGRIMAENTKEGGALFSFALPLEEGDRDGQSAYGFDH